MTVSKDGRRLSAAILADRTVVGAWEKATAGGSQRRPIYARSRSAGGAWSPRVTVSRPSDRLNQYPRVIASGAGRALLLWHGYGSGGGLLVRHRSRNGTWTPIQKIGDIVNDEFDVAVDSNGRAVIAWADDATNVYARMRSAEGVLGPVMTLATETAVAPNLNARGLGAPRVALDDRGDALVAWSRSGDICCYSGTAHARWISAGGRLEPPVQLADTGLGSGPVELVVTPQRDAVLAWQSFDEPMPADPRGSRVLMRTLSRAGTAGGLENVSAYVRHVRRGGQSVDYSADVQVAAFSDDTAMITWNVAGAIDARAVAADGSLRRVASVAGSRGRNSVRPRLATNGRRTVLTWHRYVGDRSEVWAAAGTRAALGKPRLIGSGGPVLSTMIGFPSVSMNASGNTLVFADIGTFGPYSSMAAIFGP